MKKLNRLLLFGFCYSVFLWNMGVQASYVPNGMPQAQGIPMNTTQAVPVPVSNAPQGQPANVQSVNIVRGLPNSASSIDVMGAAHQAKTAISAFITALNNWEEAQTAAGLLPNNNSLQVNTNANLQKSPPNEEEEVQKSKKKKKKKNKKKKKSRKKKEEIVQPAQQISQGQPLPQMLPQIQPISQQINQSMQPIQAIQPIQSVPQIQQMPQQNDDWKNVIPNKVSIVIPKKNNALFADAQPSSRKSYRLNKEDREQFRRELDRYRGTNKEKSTKKA